MLGTKLGSEKRIDKRDVVVNATDFKAFVAAQTELFVPLFFSC